MITTYPHSAEIESRMLGALICIGTSRDMRVRKCMLGLDKSCFHILSNRDIFEVIQKLYHQESDFSIVGMLDLIPDHIHGYFHSLMDEQYYTANLIESDLHNLQLYRQLRDQTSLLSSAYNRGLNFSTPSEALDEISHTLGKISQSMAQHRKNLARTYAEIAEEYLDLEHEDLTEIEVDIPGLPAIPNKSLITIAGRSGHGKTMIAIYLMDKLGIRQPEKQILYFNLEMQETVMLERHARIIGGQGSTRKEIITSVLAKLIERNVSLISEPMIAIEDIELQCQISAIQQPISVIVVDYLGLISSRTKTDRKDLEQANIAKRLAALALNLDCVVIDLIQVNRESKTRAIGERCPIPSDSSESMGSVHSAGWWLGIDQPQNDSDADEFKNLFQIRCRKNRFEGGLFRLDLDFIDGRFFERTRKYATKPATHLNTALKF